MKRKSEKRKEMSCEMDTKGKETNRGRNCRHKGYGAGHGGKGDRKGRKYRTGEGTNKGKDKCHGQGGSFRSVLFKQVRVRKTE